ncbi:hypothetical protein [Nonomuraea sp. NPDC003804]|uniref:hypothetical protein n=1 Tax=Nonomuraea sp. NPDC003804 TaxID=3154547 RepID=UPI0033AFC8FA
MLLQICYEIQLMECGPVGAGGVEIAQAGSPEEISPGLAAALAEPFMAFTIADRSDTGLFPS